MYSLRYSTRVLWTSNFFKVQGKHGYVSLVTLYLNLNVKIM